ncbi:MAG TPA: tRNA pseudouridine(55) synthase TruB [Elusimicrobiota bacterium]|nr:tRNA pseudouridine(55) synthase TruB [Elusimicrobiota bacterium]
MPEGLLLVDKPKGWTSHDVVAVLRKLTPKGTKVGHSGTLDPMATGLLVLLFVKATKSAATLQGLPKIYSGSIRLGVRTETADMDGKVTAEAPVPALSIDQLRALLDSLTGDLEMPVPRYSAVKHEGRPLYDYARKGIETPEKRRVSRVDSWELLSWESPELAFRVHCGSGTYVRSLAELVGEKLGCGAALSALRREAVGTYPLSDAAELAALRAGGAAFLESRLKPLEAAPA